MANPSGTHHQDSKNASSSFNGPNPGNGNPVGESSGSGTALKHNPGISTDWSPEEQAILDEGLAKYSMDSSIIRYAKIAMLLQNKTVRDVALRCRWMTKKENSKRRKEDNLARKSKDKKEKATDPSAKTSNYMARPNVPPYATSTISSDHEDSIIFKAIGGVTGVLLEQNAQALNQISANLTAMKFQDNIRLFCRTRDNLVRIMNDMDDVPELMKQMPPLPVNLNEPLAAMLPRFNLPMK